MNKNFNVEKDFDPCEGLDLASLLSGGAETVANLQLPDPTLLNYYKYDRDRVVWIDDTIDDSTLDVVKFIMQKNREDIGVPKEERKRILLMLNSPGGSVEVGQSIIGAMKISNTTGTPVDTCVYCVAYSMAGDLLACGGKRYAMPFTNVMLHAGSCAYSGTQAAVEAAKTFFDAMGKRVVDEVASRTTLDAKMRNKRKKDDVYFNEEEALKCGLIDKIVESFDELF